MEAYSHVLTMICLISVFYSNDVQKSRPLLLKKYLASMLQLSAIFAHGKIGAPIGLDLQFFPS